MITTGKLKEAIKRQREVRLVASAGGQLQPQFAVCIESQHDTKPGTPYMQVKYRTALLSNDGLSGVWHHEDCGPWFTAHNLAVKAAIELAVSMGAHLTFGIAFLRGVSIEAAYQQPDEGKLYSVAKAGGLVR